MFRSLFRVSIAKDLQFDGRDVDPDGDGGGFGVGLGVEKKGKM
jgi:hypothetical protein